MSAPIERRIAGKALELVLQAKSDCSGQGQGYRSRCENLPILLRTAGLAQTATFLKAKSDDDKAVYKHLEAQLRELGLLGATETLIAKSTDPALTAPQYRMLLEMAMLVAFWHKRMAQALIAKDGEE